MTIVEYYQNLPKRAINPRADFVRDIVINCNVSEITVRQWMSGRFTPGEREHMEYIAQKTGIPVEELFPKSAVAEEASK